MDSEPPGPGQAPVWPPAVVLVVGLGLCVGAAAVVTSSPFAAGHRGIEIAAHVLVIAAPIGAGVYAISRRRATRFGWLLVILGLVSAPTVLAESSNRVLYSIGRVDVFVVELMLIYLVLAFPSGRLQTRIDKTLFGFAVGLFALLYLPTTLFVHDFVVPNPWSGCEAGCPSNAFMLNGSQPGVIDEVVVPLRDAGYVLLLLAVTGVLAYRLTHETRLMRLTLAPVLVFAIVRIALTVLFIVMRRAAPASAGTAAVGATAVFATSGLAVGFLVGLVRWRMFAITAVRRLATDFGGPPSGAPVRDVLAGAFEDPSLEIIYWAPDDPGRWVDTGGKPVRLPSEGSNRGVTEISDGGRRVAALVHDAALADPPIISEVAGGFALVALENQRLAAELRSSLRELRESRARILSAADKERQRIERDLHDGAQQRLVALGIKLELARERVESDAHDGSELLREIGTDVDDALGEVRSLAHGVYPSLLADYGLVKALRTAAQASPVHVTVTAGDLGRYPEAIESAVYFCCLEAFQNAAKHAKNAGFVSLTLSETDDARLAFQVRDDGPGLVQPVADGAGLANMRDRVAAVGGSLAIDSSSSGTRIAGEVPLGLIELSPELETLLRRATDALDECFGIFRAVRDQRGGVVDFLVEHVNEAAGRHLGYSREDAIGGTLGQLVPGYVESEAFRWHRHVLAGGESMSTEDLSYSGPFADAGHLQRAYDVGGAPLDGDRLVVSWRDITERKRTELELRMQSVALNGADEGVCLIRASDRIIVYANPRFAQIFGYSPGELNGRPISVLSWEDQPGDGERRAGQIAQLLERRGAAYFEVHNRRKDGTPLWTEAHVTAFEHPGHGRVWAAVQQEIAEPREGWDTRRTPEEPLQTGIKRAPLVLFTLDRDLRCTWFFNSQVGLGGDQSAIGKTDLELFGPGAGSRLSAINRGVLDSGQGVRTELVLELARGRATFDLAVEPLQDSEGDVDGIAVTAHDVSNRMTAVASGENRSRRFVRDAPGTSRLSRGPSCGWIKAR